jgi:hypothetical protein
MGRSGGSVQDHFRQCIRQEFRFLETSNLTNPIKPNKKLQHPRLAQTGDRELDAIEYWKLCDELTVVQTALLIVDADPSELQYTIDELPIDLRPRGYTAVLSSIVVAINSLSLRATDNGSGCFYNGQEWKLPVNSNKCQLVTITVEDLKSWLKERGISNGSFFSNRSSRPDYLDSDHQHYSSKLAAAVFVWEAINADPKSTKGRSPKTAMKKWFQSHASEFGLVKADQGPNLLGIEEIAKVANWQTKGGAPRT